MSSSVRPVCVVCVWCVWWGRDEVWEKVWCVVMEGACARVWMKLFEHGQLYRYLLTIFLEDAILDNFKRFHTHSFFQEML